MGKGLIGLWAVLFSFSAQAHDSGCQTGLLGPGAALVKRLQANLSHSILSEPYEAFARHLLQKEFRPLVEDGFSIRVLGSGETLPTYFLPQMPATPLAGVAPTELGPQYQQGYAESSELTSEKYEVPGYDDVMALLEKAGVENRKSFEGSPGSFDMALPYLLHKMLRMEFLLDGYPAAVVGVPRRIWLDEMGQPVGLTIAIHHGRALAGILRVHPQDLYRIGAVFADQNADAVEIGKFYRMDGSAFEILGKYFEVDGQRTSVVASGLRIGEGRKRFWTHWFSWRNEWPGALAPIRAPRPAPKKRR
ncbi:MAG: hypothetical protein AB7F86_06095 [Bdellovibrionales bacterium]